LLGRDFARIWSGIKLTIYGVTQKIGIGKFRLDAVTAFLLALRNYRPKPLDVKAVLILADRDAPPSAEGLDQIWQILIPADLKISHVAADHDELIRNPFAKDVAVSIEEQLQARPGSLEARSARSENEVTATR
jgi:hypothetical protein